jgi:hypothetical protein
LTKSTPGSRRDPAWGEGCHPGLDQGCHPGLDEGCHPGLDEGCHPGLDPGSMTSWIAGQARNDNDWF